MSALTLQTNMPKDRSSGHQRSEGVSNRLLERVDVDSDLPTQIAKNLLSGLPTTGMRSC